MSAQTTRAGALHRRLAPDLRGPAVLSAEPIAPGVARSLSFCFHGDEKSSSEGVSPQAEGSPCIGGIFASSTNIFSAALRTQPALGESPGSEALADGRLESAVPGLDSKDM